MERREGDGRGEGRKEGRRAERKEKVRQTGRVRVADGEIGRKNPFMSTYQKVAV